MALIGSLKVKGKIYRVDCDNNNPHLDLYHIKEWAEARATVLRNMGYLVRVRKTLCTSGTEEVWQVFKCYSPQVETS